MRLKSATALAGVVLAATTAGAFARPAVTTASANLRSGPGVQNPVVAVVPAGARIDVGKCMASWRRVRAASGSGYISRALIAFGGARGPAVAAYAPDYGAASSGAGYAYDNAYNDYGYGGYGFDSPGYASYDYGWGPDVGLGLYGGAYGGGWRGGRHWNHRGVARGPARGVGAPGFGRGTVATVPGAGFHGALGMHAGGLATAPARVAPGAGGFHTGGFHAGGFHAGGFHGAPGVRR
jgi:uncharacterized protein YraI